VAAAARNGINKQSKRLAENWQAGAISQWRIESGVARRGACGNGISERNININIGAALMAGRKMAKINIRLSEKQQQ
jgi:hypothetical protein